MKFLKLIISRPNILFVLALLAGFIFPQVAAISIVLILPALMIIMTITPLKIPRGFFRRFKPLIIPAIQGNIMNYILMGNLIIFTSLFFVQAEELWIGMVLVAAAPPAVGVLSSSKPFGADLIVSFAGFAGAYLGALLIIPLIGLGFLKYSQLNFWILLLIIVMLIVLPLVLSRIIVEKGWDKVIEMHDGLIIDFCFFIVFYTIAAKIREFVINWTYDMSAILIIATLSVFIVFFVFGKIGRLFHVAENKIVSLTLLGTMKNYGLAGGIALIVFSPEVAFASLAFAVINFIYINWLKYINLS